MSKAFITFETRPVEDKVATRKEGHTVYKDVDIAVLTPPGNNLLTVEKRVNDALLKQWKNDPEMSYRVDAYEAYKDGKDAPIDGTPLTEWPSAKPADVKNCHNLNIYSVEDLAECDENALRRLGMGGRALKQKAQAWLQSASDIGKTAEELAELRALVEFQKGCMEDLQAKIDAMESAKPKPRKKAPAKEPVSDAA